MENILVTVGVAMFAGLLLSRLVSKLNLPDVTSYLVAGLLVGPLVLGRFGIDGLGFSSFHYVEGMGLVDLLFLPHFNDLIHQQVDGLRVVEDIMLPDSFEKPFFTIPDGSYFLLDEERLRELCAAHFSTI